MLDLSGGNARVYGTSYSGSGNYAGLYLGDGMAGVAAVWGAGLRFDVYGPGSNGVLGTNSLDALSISQLTGNVGIGTMAPAHKLDIFSNETVGSDGTYPLFAEGASGKGVVLGYNSSADMAEIAGVQSGVAWKGLLINPFGGNVGIGTTNPARKLHIAGDVQIDGALYFGSNTTAQSLPFAGISCTGADYAEAIDVTGDRTKYEPGDVLVIDPNAPGKFLKANQAYSTLVAGIYSTKPGFVGRKQPPTPETIATEVSMAMVGRVPAKVTAENGPIKVGDLLVASSMSGRAMKGTDRNLLTGAVIGKALGALDSGTGVIEVLVTLQ
jgi:hypothetical protein